MPTTPLKMGRKQQNSTIQAFFPPAPSKKRRIIEDLPASPAKSWSLPAGIVYKQVKIGQIQPGPGRITFTGRVANYREVEKNSKLATAAKILLRMALMDETGSIDIKFWLTRPLAATHRVKLGALATVHTTFVSALSSEESESSAAKFMISVSDTDKSANVEFLADSDENWADFRVPIGMDEEGKLEKLMPLKCFVETGSDTPGHRLMVCVKWKGAKKTIPKKDGGTVEKRDIGVFDDSMEGTLTLWGSMVSTADTWEISKTVLLLASPSLKLWRRDVQLTCGPATLVCVDPIHRDTQWLRTYAQKLLRKPDICAPFPYDEFDWKAALYGEQRMKFTFGDIDKYSRNIDAYVNQLPAGQCVGWLNVVITEINVSSLYRRNMLLCGSCCGFTVFTNELSPGCRKCDQPIESMRPNPNIVGRISDETGCVSGGSMIWSEQAWESLLGRNVKELSENTSPEVLRYFDEFFLFMRINLAFGWDPEIGKIAVWDVVPS
ncbi:hypothetical protein FN846DRAFT_933308 [Sphaerosporella brunnea]|uniref:Uncharacterized protein n=1 Tax=Sphaerosporella brunnea TaxID=1250544 RepID=A0A5J5F6Y3_9PEZI|nr:hypothetical protein FN846DRAFT_933308 [Sphaerosporella brunnea]